MSLREYGTSAGFVLLGLAAGGVVGWVSLALSPIGLEAIGYMPLITYWAEGVLWVIVGLVAPKYLGLGDHSTRKKCVFFGLLFGILGPGVPLGGFVVDAVASPFLASNTSNSTWPLMRFVLIVVTYGVGRAALGLVLSRTIIR